MAELPSVPLTETVKPIRTSLSPGEIAGPYSMLARGLEKTGAAADEVATSLAVQAGAKAVTTDADGNIQVDHPPIIGPAAKAFGDTVKMAALAEGEGAARRKDIELRQQYRDNPEGYMQAADSFARQMQTQYGKAAGPLVGLAMRKAIESQTTTTYKGLLNEHERLELHRSVEKLNSELEHEVNTVSAMAAGGITSGEEWDQSWNKIDTIYHTFTTNPRLAYPPEKAAQEKAKLRDEVAVRGMQYHIVNENYDKEPDKAKAYDQAAKDAETILTDPKLNLSPAQREAAYHRVLAALNGRQRQDEAVFNGISKEMGALAKTATDGYPVAIDRLAQLRTAVETNGDPRLAAGLEQTERVIQFMGDARKMNQTQLERTIAGMDAAGAPEPLIKGTEKLLDNMRKGLQADMVGWADRAGVVSMPPIQFSGPPEMRSPAGQMRDRAAAAEVAAAHYGVAPTYLRPEEVSALTAATAKGGPETVAVAKMIADGFGDRAPVVMKQISKEAPQLAHIGALSMAGGDQSFVQDVALGTFLRTDPEAKKLLPPISGNQTNIVQSAQADRVRDQYGDAFAQMTEGGLRAQLAAKDAFIAQSQRQGWDPTLGQGTAPPGTHQRGSAAAFDKALQQSAGATFHGDGVQYGGVAMYGAKPWFGAAPAKVLVPGDVRADKFKDVIGSITDADLPPGAPFKARDVREAVPYAIPGDRYVFAKGDVNSGDPKYVGDSRGPFVLSFDEFRARFQQRVPSAFLGRP